MGDVENANEIIDDLRDEVHDLEHDLRTSEKECLRLEAEVDELIEDQELSVAVHKREVTILEDTLRHECDKVMEITKELSALDGVYQKSRYNYFKALSIAETLHCNGNTEYFKTADGKALLNWGVNELKEEARRNLGGR